MGAAVRWSGPRQYASRSRPCSADIATGSSPAGRPRGDGPGARPQRGQVVVDEVADALDGEIRGWVAGEGLRIVRVVPLPGEYGGHASAPRALHRRQHAELVVHEHVVLGGIPAL